jgi:hypothetical protein
MRSMGLNIFPVSIGFKQNIENMIFSDEEEGSSIHMCGRPGLSQLQ